MSKNYKNLITRVQSRLNPENVSFQKSLNEDLATVTYSDIHLYIRLAMNAVPPEYTAKSKQAGEMVKKHLGKELSSIQFKYQGSVMTDTHIKGISDIDLLVISDKSYRIDSMGIQSILNNFTLRQRYYQSALKRLEVESAVTSYTGNALEDLRNLRADCETILNSIYSICDISKPNSIKIKNLNLDRDVDTVIANWYDNIDSIINGKGDFRGIQVYNKKDDVRGDVSFPFLSISKINDRSSTTGGRLKKMIRFIKNVKEDSTNTIDLNSFEINAICYDINISEYQDKHFKELVGVIYRQLKSISSNADHANKIISVDGTEMIFKGKPNKINQLIILMSEIESIYSDLYNLRRAI